MDPGSLICWLRCFFAAGWISGEILFQRKTAGSRKKRECWQWNMHLGFSFIRKIFRNLSVQKQQPIPWWRSCCGNPALPSDQAANFYVAGAFGKHVSKESAIAIGMYPDMDRNRIINAGNSSLEGAQKLLLERSCLADIDRIIEEMVYIQFAAVDDFLNMMVAAQALPHTDYQRFPTVMEQLRKRQAIENQSGKEM